MEFRDAIRGMIYDDLIKFVRSRSLPAIQELMGDAKMSPQCAEAVQIVETWKTGSASNLSMFDAEQIMTIWNDSYFEKVGFQMNAALFAMSEDLRPVVRASRHLPVRRPRRLLLRPRHGNRRC